jgi:hypothetical protein
MAVLPGEGAFIASASASSGTFTSFAQVLSITPPGGIVASVETTTLSDTAKTFRPGVIPDSGECAMRIQYDPNLAGHQSLTTLITTPVTRWFRVSYASGHATPSRDTFQAFLTEFSPDALEDETNQEADVTMKITGSVSRTSGS